MKNVTRMLTMVKLSDQIFISFLADRIVLGSSGVVAYLWTVICQFRRVCYPENVEARCVECLPLHMCTNELFTFSLELVGRAALDPSEGSSLLSGWFAMGHKFSVPAINAHVWD